MCVVADVVKYSGGVARTGVVKIITVELELNSFPPQISSDFRYRYVKMTEG